jgi:redox-sensitive bicupin YhaK (pirin superfamily)
MITLRKSEERGKTRIDWLDSRHSFSFGDYRDARHMGFGPLRVINEDFVAAGAGFPTHPHRDMEIITYLLAGELSHKDSLGTGSTIAPGEVQRMSAGTGIRHSEFNPSADNATHLLQIWIIPEEENITPSYEQKDFSQKRKAGQLTLLASPDGREGSVTIHQQASMSVLDLDAGQTFTHTPTEGRLTWVQVARGNAEMNGQALRQGDGAAVRDEKSLQFKASDKAEILLFDLPA